MTAISATNVLLSSINNAHFAQFIRRRHAIKCLTRLPLSDIVMEVYLVGFEGNESVKDQN